MAKVFIEETTLTAIGDAIREKEGTTELVPVTAMAMRITNLPTGGGSSGNELTEEDLTFSGALVSSFDNNTWNWFIDKFGNKIKTENVTTANAMFQSNPRTQIPFSINFDTQANGNQGHDLSYMFTGASYLESVPKMTNVKPSSLQSMFGGCNRLRNLPNDFTTYFNWEHVPYMYNPISAGQMFESCYSLRSVPVEIFENLKPECDEYSSYFYWGFGSCYALDELVNLPVPYTTEWYSNAFQETVPNCHRLKNFTFALNPITNSPYVVSWTNQVIDLSYKVGHATGCSANILNYNSGIIPDKKISYDTYEKLKDDPDAWTDDYAFSRYNHDSAVATINSLPDTYDFLLAADGTNTIQFNQYSGFSTDGGGISSLTEEEIAVAAAKGWTVALV